MEKCTTLYPMMNQHHFIYFVNILGNYARNKNVLTIN